MKISSSAANQGMTRTSILGDFKRLALALGIEPDPLMHRVGINARHLEDSELTIPVHMIVELLELAALTSGINDFGLRLAEARGLPDLGLINIMLREEETVRAAIHTLVDFMHLHSDAACMNFEEHEPPILTMSLMGCSDSNHRQAMDVSVAQVTSILRWLLGEHWSPESICFTHSRPLSTARYTQFFRCPVDFLHEFNGIVLRKKDLDQMLSMSSPVIRRQVERYLKTLGGAPRDSYSKRVSKMVAYALPKGEAKIDIIAANMNTTARTLNRRLAKAGLNFSTVLENIRKELATQYLVDDERPISDIASMVGFNSLSAFSTWFRNTFDCTPRSWRETHSWSGYRSSQSKGSP